MKSVDLQTLLPRVTEVAKTRQVEQQRPGAAQQQFAAEIRRADTERGRQVPETKSADGQKVDRDGGRRAGGKAADQQRGRDGTGKEDPDRPKEAGAKGARSRGGRGQIVDIVLDYAEWQGGC